MKRVFSGRIGGKYPLKVTIDLPEKVLKEVLSEDNYSPIDLIIPTDWEENFVPAKVRYYAPPTVLYVTVSYNILIHAEDEFLFSPIHSFFTSRGYLVEEDIDGDSEYFLSEDSEEILWQIAMAVTSTVGDPSELKRAVRRDPELREMLEDLFDSYFHLGGVDSYTKWGMWISIPPGGRFKMDWTVEELGQAIISAAQNFQLRLYGILIYLFEFRKISTLKVDIEFEAESTYYGPSVSPHSAYSLGPYKEETVLVPTELLRKCAEQEGTDDPQKWSWDSAKKILTFLVTFTDLRERNVDLFQTLVRLLSNPSALKVVTE